VGGGGSGESVEDGTAGAQHGGAHGSWRRRGAARSGFRKQRAIRRERL